MASQKTMKPTPPIISFYLLLAIFFSIIWFTGFTIQILKSPYPILLESALILIYLLHLTITIYLPLCSRPWLWSLESNKSTDFLEFSMIALGYDDYDKEHWTIGGIRSVAALIVGVSPFLVPIEKSGWGFAVIVSMAVEFFFVVEMVKHKEMEEGVFYAAMVGATAASRAVFGYSASESVMVILLCLGLVFFHSFLPFYDDDEFLFPAEVGDGYAEVAELA